MAKLKTIVIVGLMLAVGADARAGYNRGGHYTLDELYAAVRAVASAHPDLVSLEEIGESVEGRPLLMLRIARRDGKDRPEALIYGNVHAMEWMGGRMALACAERLADDDGRDPWITQLLDRSDFYIIPLMTPDGYEKASRRLDLGFTTARKNADRVDLNRNWPYPEEARIDSFRGAFQGGGAFKWQGNYRGPHPLSEPENRALDQLVAAHEFFIIFDLHTVGGRFSYPWSYKEDAAPDQEMFRQIGAELAAHQDYFPYQAHQSYSWYQIVGSSKDWFYGHYGSPAVTIEVGNAEAFDHKKIGLRALNPFFQYNPVDVETWIGNDRDAILYAADKARELTGGKRRAPVGGIEWVTE
jgi:carboxypeptidase T